MLPSAKRYLDKAGHASQQGGLILVAFFVVGFLGIQIVSRFLHQYMPSHVVDCDHTHDEPHPHRSHEHHHHDHHGHHHSDGSSHTHPHTKRKSSRIPESPPSLLEIASESTPLLGKPGQGVDSAAGLSSKGELASGAPVEHGIRRASTIAVDDVDARARTASLDWRRASMEGVGVGHVERPSIAKVQQRVLSFVKDSKPNCDSGGPCYGFSDPCGLECRKRLGIWPSRPTAATRKEIAGVSRTHSHIHEPADMRCECSRSSTSWPSQAQSSETEVGDEDGQSACSHSSDIEAQNHQHHHHVHNNAFLSLGLQTSIAITLHKFPEGFITYATNHANPDLGLNVFTALFVHNITEGFALALPLYMALGSRLRAMLWASLLGGLSQPAGAGIAALWFHLAQRTEMRLDETVYACLFSVTAGIMVSVALELFVESLSLNHNRNLSIFCAFIGMVVLGLSNAFVSGR